MSLCATRKARKCADSDSTAPPVPRYRRIFEGGLAIVDSLAGAEADVDPAHGFRAGAATLARTMAFPASRLCLRDSRSPARTSFVTIFRCLGGKISTIERRLSVSERGFRCSIF